MVELALVTSRMRRVTERLAASGIGARMKLVGGRAIPAAHDAHTRRGERKLRSMMVIVGVVACPAAFDGSALKQAETTCYSIGPFFVTFLRT